MPLVILYSDNEECERNHNTLEVINSAKILIANTENEFNTCLNCRDK
jgi:hypothetical protein